MRLSAWFLAAAALAQTPDPSRLRADLDFLCSDLLEGRASLSRGADIAARYIAADFARSGLRPAAANGSYRQEFPMVGYRSDPAGRALILVRAGREKAFHPGSSFTGAFSRDVRLRAPVLFVGYGITAPEFGYDDYAGVDAAGKVVLMFDHEPQENDPQSVFNGAGHTLHAGRVMKVANARRHGAVAALIASEPLRTHPGLLQVQPSQGQALRASAPTQALDEEGQIPAYTISDDVLAELLRDSPRDVQRAIDTSLKPRSSALADTVVELRGSNVETRRGISSNVVGLLEGSDPVLKDETVLITAHYDHLGLQNGNVYGGANDNGSGTVAVMELARMFAGAGTRPKRSLLFAVFGSEEQQMLGSFYYTAHPLRPLATTRAVINLDMIARDEAHIPQSLGALEIPADTSNELNLVGAEYSPALRAIIEAQNAKAGLVLSTKFERDHVLNALFRCDHLPFLMEKIPAVWLFGGFHPGYHEPSDTVEKLNFPKMEKTLRLAWLVSAEVANAASPPAFTLRGGR